MRRAVLMLAAFGLALTGCYSRSSPPPPACTPVGTLTVYWQAPQGGGFVNPSGTLVGCDAAGVSDLDVYVNGQVQASRVPCHGPSADGIQLTGFTDETVKLRLDAFDAQGNLLYQDFQNVSTAYCYDTTVDVQLAAVAAPFTVSYALPGGAACSPGTYVWLSLVDVTGNVQFDLVDAGHAPTDVPCGTVLTYPKALYGQYRLDFLQVVQSNGGPASTWAAQYEYCAPVTANHSVPNDQLIVPTLQPATGCR